MGIIDQTKHVFECPKCGNREVCMVYDKGSNYGGSWWQHGSTLEKFNVQWDGGDSTEPRVVKATCKCCGTDAKHTESY